MAMLDRLMFGTKDVLGVSEDIPGVAELRSLDKHLQERPFWVHNLAEEEEGQDETWPRLRLVRFGSRTEQLIHWIMRLLSLYELFITTFISSFDAVYPLRRTPMVILMDAAQTALFALGVAAQFRTTFVSTRNCVEVKDLELIKRELLSQWRTWCDFAALVSAPLLYIRGWGSLVCLLRLLKCWRLPRDERREKLQSRVGTDTGQQLATIAVGIFVATHLYACCWFQAKMLSSPGYGHEWSSWNGWSKDVFDVDQADSGALSVPIETGTLKALAWCYARAWRDGAYMLISWAGPNAISPIELLVIGLLSPLSGLIMAYVYALFVSALEQSRMLDQKFEERMSVLTVACKDMGLPTELCNRIRRYYSFLMMQHMGCDSQELISQLSANLTSEMRMFRMRNVIIHANFFEGMSYRVILLLVQTFTEQAFAPGDMVVRKGEVADCMYIILHGVVSVLVDDEAQICVRRMHDNDVFGELCFLKENSLRTAWVRAETYLVLWRFDKEAFNELIACNEEAKTQMINQILKRANQMTATDGQLMPDLVKMLKSLNAKDGLPMPPTTEQASLAAQSDGESLTIPAAVADSSADSATAEDNETTPLMSAERQKPASQVLESTVSRRPSTLSLNGSAGVVLRRRSSMLNGRGADGFLGGALMGLAENSTLQDPSKSSPPDPAGASLTAKDRQELTSMKTHITNLESCVRTLAMNMEAQQEKLMSMQLQSGVILCQLERIEAALPGKDPLATDRSSQTSEASQLRSNSKCSGKQDALPVVFAVQSTPQASQEPPQETLQDEPQAHVMVKEPACDSSGHSTTPGTTET